MIALYSMIRKFIITVLLKLLFLIVLCYRVAGHVITQQHNTCRIIGNLARSGTIKILETSKIKKTTNICYSLMITMLTLINISNNHNFLNFKCSLPTAYNL